MIISPKFRSFICTTAHPSGCEYNVQKQVDYVLKQNSVNGPKKVLVIGSSTGYGLASRIVASFASGAATLGVFFEKPYSDNRTATPGWYNSAAFEKLAGEAGYYAKSINGDAFSSEIKTKVIDTVKNDFGQVDLVIYSLAAPRRTNPVTGETFNSVLKPIGKTYTNKTINVHTEEVSEVTIEPATEDEVRQTVGVMGGEDWEMWINALNEAGVLAKGAITLAYSYIGPAITHAIYREGTIGRAKDHLEATANKMTEEFKEQNIRAYVSVNKALVTHASSAIPVVPLYISMLMRIMKEKGIDEGCIEQIYRLFNDRLYPENLQLDSHNRIRIDDWEMREDVQEEITKLWRCITTENVNELTDIEGYRKDLYNLFGFGFEEIDYDREVDPEIGIPSID